jgi:hypothetical protein
MVSFFIVIVFLLKCRYHSAQNSTSFPTSQPSKIPSAQPSIQPTSEPTRPTTSPTVQPTSQPSKQPSGEPSCQPSSVPSSCPSIRPTQNPICPSSQPTSKPSIPTSFPSSLPSLQPTVQPISFPTMQPTCKPSQPTAMPSTHPSLLSYDICLLIMEFVSAKRVCRLACVNTTFRAASQCMELWRHKYILRWPLKFDAKTPAGVKEKGSSQVARCPSCYPPLGKKTPMRRKPCPANCIFHNWQELYKVGLSYLPIDYSHYSWKEKAIATKKIVKGSSRSICDVVGCTVMLRNEECKQVRSRFALTQLIRQ